MPLFDLNCNLDLKCLAARNVFLYLMFLPCLDDEMLPAELLMVGSDRSDQNRAGSSLPISETEEGCAEWSEASSRLTVSAAAVRSCSSIVCLG